jgi:hypothetical protein
MSLTDTEYEDAYAEALLCLADDGRVVGAPFYNGSGARYCMVDGRKLTDQDVLELWWEKDIAREILKGR